MDSEEVAVPEVLAAPEVVTAPEVIEAPEKIAAPEAIAALEEGKKIDDLDKLASEAAGEVAEEVEEEAAEEVEAPKVVAAHLATAEFGQPLFFESQLPVRLFYFSEDLSCTVLGSSAKGKAHCIQAIAWSPDGEYLALGSDDGFVRVFDTYCSLFRRFQCKKGVRSLSWRSDSEVIATGCFDGSATLFNVILNCKVRRYLYDDCDAVWSVSFAPSGSHLALSDDRRTRILDTDTGEKLWEVDIGHFGWYLGWKPDASQILVGSGSFPGLQLLDANTGKSRLEFAIDGVRLVAAWRPDGARFVVAQGSLVLMICSSTGKLLLPRFMHTGKVTAVSWTADGGLLATGAKDKLARVFNGENGRLLISIEHGAEVRCVHWKPTAALDSQQIQPASKIDGTGEAPIAQLTPGCSADTGLTAEPQSRFRGLTKEQLAALHAHLPTSIGAELALVNCRVDLPVLCDFLADNRWTFPRLKHLDLSGNPGIFGAIDGVLNAKMLEFRELECLLLCDCVVTPFQLEQFVETPASCPPRLRILKLDRNPGLLDTVEPTTLAFNHLESLQVLSLSACNVKYRQRGFIELISYYPPPMLKKLVLASNPGILHWDEAEFKFLPHPWRLENVVELNLASCSLLGTDLKSLACIVQPCSVTHLDLSQNPTIFQDFQVVNLATMRVWHHLSLLHLCLSKCTLDVDGLIALILALPETLLSLQLDILPDTPRLSKIMAEGSFTPDEKERYVWVRKRSQAVHSVADPCTPESNRCMLQ